MLAVNQDRIKCTHIHHFLFLFLFLADLNRGGILCLIEWSFEKRESRPFITKILDWSTLTSMACCRKDLQHFLNYSLKAEIPISWVSQPLELSQEMLSLVHSWYSQKRFKSHQQSNRLNHVQDEENHVITCSSTKQLDSDD